MKNNNRLLLVMMLGLLGLAMLRPPQELPLFDSNGQVQHRPVLRPSYTEFLDMARQGQFDTVFVTENGAMTRTEAGSPVSVALPENSDIADKLAEMKVNVRVVPPEEPSLLFSLFVALLPLFLIFGFWWFIHARMAKGGAMGFGKSKARLESPKDGKTVTFADVAGVNEAKTDLAEVVSFLKEPQRFQALGAKIPRGVLLVGPPGTGKTLLARAVAGEAGVPFFSTSGSDFVEMYVGVGASRVRSMFAEARKHAPCIVFIDEIDAMGRSRASGLGGNDEREQTLNAMLVELDGFAPNDGVILVAATNRPDVLDPALLRPGRFDRQVTVANPDMLGRVEILKVHTRKTPLAADISLEVVSRGTPGFSGAELANLVNEAALMAARRGAAAVSMVDFESAKDKILMGAERRTMTMSPEEIRLTAYHEAGHALVAMMSPASDPVHKATIVPRGQALGVVIRLPERDRVSMSLEKMEADLTVGMAGRVAEELVFGARQVTSGASSDIQMVTALAQRMVSQWGFSEKLGTVRYAQSSGNSFLGHVDSSGTRSEATAQLMDEEVRRIIQEATERARTILIEHRATLEAIAQALIERETLSGEELLELKRGNVLPPLPAFGIAASGAAPGEVSQEPGQGEDAPRPSPPIIHRPWRGSVPPIPPIPQARPSLRDGS